MYTYREDKILKKINLNAKGKLFNSNLEKKNFFKEKKNIEWFEQVMHEILSIDLIGNGDSDDLKNMFQKSASFFEYRENKDHGGVTLPCQQELSLVNFKLEMVKVENGTSVYKKFKVDMCLKYFKVDFLLYNSYNMFVHKIIFYSKNCKFIYCI
jgi:hypothetical protein